MLSLSHRVHGHLCAASVRARRTTALDRCQQDGLVRQTTPLTSATYPPCDRRASAAHSGRVTLTVMLTGHTTYDGIRIHMQMSDPQQLQMFTASESYRIPGHPDLIAISSGELLRQDDGSWHPHFPGRCHQVFSGGRPITPTDEVVAVLDRIMLVEGLRWMKRKNAVKKLAEQLRDQHLQSIDQQQRLLADNVLEGTPEAAEIAAAGAAIVEQITGLRQQVAELNEQILALQQQLTDGQSRIRSRRGMDYARERIGSSQAVVDRMNAVLQDPSIPDPPPEPAAAAQPVLHGVSGIGLRDL